MRTKPFLLLAALVLAPPVSAQEELGKKTKEHVVIQWAKLDTKSYAIEYESLIPTKTVKEIGDELEEVLAQYVAVFKFKPEGKLKVKFLDSERTYEQEGGDPSHPGFYNGGSGYLVVQQMPFFQLMPTVYHEAFHQYLQEYMGRGTPIPIWFNEGLAQYYEGIQKSKETKRLDYRTIDNRRIRRLQEAIFTRSALPLEKLIDADAATFHEKEKEELHYSESFAFAYFLMQGMGGKPVFDFANELRKTKDAKLAEAKIFGKDRKKLKGIEATWKRYVLGVKVEDKVPGAVPGR